jgi:hypothetical protein
MPLVLFGWLTSNPYFKEITDVNLREIMYRQKIKQIEEEMLPVGFINDGQQDEMFVDSGDVWSNNSEEKTLPQGYLSSRL